jgi:DNA (cytosine-5)-methyltransferase 1
MGAKTGLYMITDDGPGRTKRVKKDVTPALRAQGGGSTPGIWVEAIPVLTPNRAEKPPHIPGPEDVNNTVRSSGRGSITAKHNHDTIHDGVRIRRLTPLETFRLQGFPDSHHDNAKDAGVSDSQLYKQAGNAVTVNVVYEIAQRLEAM